VTEELHAKQQEAARKEAERAARKAPQDAAADAKGEAEEPASKKPREKEPRASTTDAQARVMKMADGGFRPAYNVQFAIGALGGGGLGALVPGGFREAFEMDRQLRRLAGHGGQGRSLRLGGVVGHGVFFLKAGPG
jgi:hypothetical protein